VPSLATAVSLSLLGSFGGLVLASPLLLLSAERRGGLVGTLVSYAVGTLLGAALLGLLPVALETLAPADVLATMLGAILSFFVLEKLVLWRHCHAAEECAVHRAAASLILVGDALHTFVDGAIVAAAVMTSVPLGISTAIAAAAHEIPQELGDFVVLLNAGYSRRRALTLNVVTGLTGIAGAVVMWLAMRPVQGALPYVLSFAAGSFLYVAMADLIPNLHNGRLDASALRQIALVLAGVATIAVL
jgi:zinc and cadmium transporter